MSSKHFDLTKTAGWNVLQNVVKVVMIIGSVCSTILMAYSVILWYVFKGNFYGSDEVIILILVVGLVLGMPIPFAFGGSFLYLTYTLHFNPSTLLASGYTQINSTILLAIPLFVLAGKIMEKGHIGDALIGLVQRFVGKIKSGLGAVAVVTCAVFGSISGSASATLSCIGALMEPRISGSCSPPGSAADRRRDPGFGRSGSPPSSLRPGR